MAKLKAYKIGLRLAQIEAIIANKKMPRRWNDIPIEESNSYYFKGKQIQEKGF